MGVFVHPWQYLSVMHALNGQVLTRSKVVIARSLEHLLEESIVDIGHGVWARQRQLLDVFSSANVDEGRSALAAVSSAEDADHMEFNRELFDGHLHWTLWPGLGVARSFICVAPGLPSSTTVVQSTTEMSSRMGLNPRRARASLDDVQ